jgi:hypothetical protein
VAGPVVVFLAAIAAAVSGVADPVVVFLVVVAGPVVVFLVVVAVVVSEVADPAVVFVAVASAADVAGPRASVDIALVFDVLVPVSVAAVEVDSSARPRFFFFPNIDYCSSSSSSVEVFGEGSAHSSTGVHTNHGPCSIFSNQDLHHNKKLGHFYNIPTPGYNNGSDTSAHPKSATTNRSRNRNPHQYQEQHTHWANQGSRSLPEVPEIQWVAAAKIRYLHPPLPMPGSERQMPTPKGLFPIAIFSCCYLPWPSFQPSSLMIVATP